MTGLMGRALGDSLGLGVNRLDRLISKLAVQSGPQLGGTLEYGCGAANAHHCAPCKAILPLNRCADSCCLATRSPSRPEAIACSTSASPSRSRIAIQRAFGTPGTSDSISGTNSEMA